MSEIPDGEYAKSQREEPGITSHNVRSIADEIEILLADLPVSVGVKDIAMTFNDSVHDGHATAEIEFEAGDDEGRKAIWEYVEDGLSDPLNSDHAYLEVNGSTATIYHRTS